MKNKKYNFFILFYLVLFCLCCQNKLTWPNEVSLFKGKKSFLDQVAKFNLNSIFGVLPPDLWDESIFSIRYDHVIKVDKDNFNEYFLFDEDRLLILLSRFPLYFLVIESHLFQSKFTRELRQIKAGIFGKDKKLVQNPFLKDLGFHRAETYLLPKELTFASSRLNLQNIGRMTQKNSTIRPRPDIWRLLNAADEAILYFPICQDEKLLSDLKLQIAEGKIRRLFCRKIIWPDNEFGIKVDTDLAFPIIFGQNLKIDDHLLDGQNKMFYDEHLLKESFVVFFSISPGNPFFKIEKKDFLNQQDGIAILIRGPLNWISNFLYSEKLPISKKIKKYYALERVQKKSFDQLILTFSEETSKIIDLKVCKQKSPSTNCDRSIISDIQKINSNQFIVFLANPISKFKFYSVYAVGQNNNNEFTNYRWRNLTGKLLISKVSVKGSKDFFEIMVIQSGEFTSSEIMIRNSSSVKTFLRFPKTFFQAGTKLKLHAQYKNKSPKDSQWSKESGIIDLYAIKNKSITSTENIIWIRDRFSDTLDFIAWGDRIHLNSAVLNGLTLALSKSNILENTQSTFLNYIVDPSLDDNSGCFIRSKNLLRNIFSITTYAPHIALNWFGGVC